MAARSCRLVACTQAAKAHMWISMLLILSTSSNATQCPSNTTANITDPLVAVVQAYPGLNIVKPKGSPFLGWQNFTYCCILALGEYQINGCADTKDITVSGLHRDSEFPCGAQYNVGDTGAPEVQVSYAWTQRHCPGWQISSATNLKQWAQMLIGFVLPAVVFCLNIPRRRKLRVWSALFLGSVDSCEILVGAAGAIAALMIVIIDTVLWLFTVFAIAAPALMSSLYEAFLDQQVVGFVESRGTLKRLPLALRARMLLTILCGNLDLYPAWADTMHLATSLEILDQADFSYNTTSQHSSSGDDPSAAATDRRETIDTPTDTTQEIELRVLKAAGALEPQTMTTTTSDSTNITQEQRKAITRKVASRLTAMLACQYSYGTACGGPVLFYIGSFLYTLLDIRQSYGDIDNSHALSFGVWYMTIPLISILSGCLLGGNSPHILEILNGAETPDHQIGGSQGDYELRRNESTFAEFHETSALRSLFARIFERVYVAAYKPVSIWNRGASKQRWLLVLCTDSLLRYKGMDKKCQKNVRAAMEHLLTDILLFSPGQWFWLAAAATFLLFMPCILGLLLSYYTPQTGLACRSLTFTVYMSAQALLVILWMIRTTWRDRYWRQGLLIKQKIDTPSNERQFWNEIQNLKNMAKADINGSIFRPSRGPDRNTTKSRDEESVHETALPSSRTHHTNIPETRQARLARLAYRIFLFLGMGVSVFSAIGGTLMQLTRIYENNICKMNVPKWLPGHRTGAMIRLSTNSPDSIHLAKSTWTILGTLSVAFLAICCYAGWTYQTKLRRHFKDVARKLDHRAADH